MQNLCSGSSNLRSGSCDKQSLKLSNLHVVYHVVPAASAQPSYTSSQTSTTYGSKTGNIYATVSDLTLMIKR